MRVALLAIGAVGAAGCCAFPQANFGPVNPCSFSRFADLHVRGRIASVGAVTSRTISAFPSSANCWTPLTIDVTEVRRGSLAPGARVTAFVAAEVSSDFAVGGQQVPFSSDSQPTEPAWFFLRTVKEGTWLGLDSIGTVDPAGRVRFVGGDFESTDALNAAVDASADSCPFVGGTLE